MSPMAMLAISGMSVLTSQVVSAEQQLVVFHTPPPSEPSHATAGLVGCVAITLVRPALLPMPKPSPSSGFGPSRVKASGSSASAESAERT